MSVDTSRSPRDGSGDDLLDALVHAERAAMEPPEDARDQTWERVVGTVALGTPPAVPPSSVASPAASSAAPWLKVVLGVLLGGAVAAIGYGVTADDPPATATAPRADAAPTPSAPAPASDPLPEPKPAPEPEPALDPRPQAPAAPAQPPAKEVRAAAKAAGPPASDLAEETRLLALARASLRAGSPPEALVPLAEHARRFPRGQLAEDRMVLRAQALCESGKRTAGREAAAALRKAFPDSSHLPRVDRACR